MVQLSKPFTTALCLLILAAVAVEPLPAFARTSQPASQQEPTEPGKRRKKRATDAKTPAPKDTANQRKGEGGEGADNRPAVREDASDTVEIVADRQSQTGDLYLFEGYVDATLEDLRLQADRVSFNTATSDMVAEGNVIFDQGPDQRVTAHRAEINWTSKRGTFWDSTGFSNRTQTGEYIYFTADRVVKTGPDTYKLFGAVITACQDVVPKWTFAAKYAEIKLGDRVTLHNAVLRVKNVPAFFLPFAWIPATRDERKSGFLIPTTGTSNQKGRELKAAYYQTLGQSADVTFRGDIYTQRGIGMGAEFRAQTDDRSYMRLGIFTVADRLFGPPGEDQGGTAFSGEGVQYLPSGWLAVGNISVVSSLRFRQVFSDDISQVVDPRRESTFYLNNNTGNVSVNVLASNENTRVFRPASDPRMAPTTGTDFDIKIRQAPQFDIIVYPRRLFENLPVYFSLDSSMGALKREESISGAIVQVTPGAVQRFDFQPKITAPLATFAGIAVTPSLSLRETFYTSSIDSRVPVFDPDQFTLDPNDPRLDPTRLEYQPGLKRFDLNALDRVIPANLSRQYAELAVEVRPPSLERDFFNPDGSRRFRHLIEPYVTYRLIRGVGDEFERILRFDERDAVANTHEVEYAVINRFFTGTHASDLTSKRRKRRRPPASEMKPVVPRKGDDVNQTSPSRTGVESQKQETAKAAEKSKLEEGQQSELKTARAEEKKTGEGGDPARQGNPAVSEEAEQEEEDDAASNENAPVQPYEFLTVKVAQKYFFDRHFGGALIDGRRNQFYPLNTLSGYTYGGRSRSLSPANIAVRYRPLSAVFADLRMDVGADEGVVRDVTLSGGVRTDKLVVTSGWHLSRRIELAPNSFEPGTFPGNQVFTTVQFGDGLRGLYGGTRIGYDFTDRFISSEKLSKGRLRNSRSYLGYAWDCCGLQFNYNTFKAGLRIESAFSFTFTLAGLGSFGTDQFSQLGGSRGGRKRGKRARRDSGDDFP
ncbi:MAG TPA: putative LPS assembly protein LptD [Blastocatellia bacterium]|nr:putative LPS assembly protein LptD [Blastocatellia bacterium]